MYSLDYNLENSINYYLELINDYNIFYTFVLAFILLGFLLFFNINNKNISILTILINFLFIFLIFNCFGLEILDNLNSCLSKDFLHNICFYYIGTIISLVASSVKINSLKTSYGAKVILIIMYLLIILNLSFALYISYNIDSNLFIIMGNTYPMILIGNLISILLYIYIFVLILIEKTSKIYDKKKHLIYNWNWQLFCRMI